MQDILKQNYLIKFSSYASIVVAVLIMIIRLFSWFITDSQSVLTSLIDSAVDISTSCINLIIVRISLLPPDDKHRFGHNKFQDLAVFSQSIFFLTSCLLILFISFKNLLFVKEAFYLDNTDVGLKLTYISLILTLILVVYQSYVHKVTKSNVIAADRVHYASDIFLNIAIIVSLNFSSDFWYIDSVSSIIIACYFMWIAYRLFKISLSNLVDTEFLQQDKDKILKIIGKYTAVKGLHELKTRYAGNKPFIQFHIEMDGNMSLRKAHDISDKISEELTVVFPSSEIIIHQDPVGVETNVNYRENI
ncbi:cation diffusion facilitator family transporter [Rickettsia endosymbiont of Cardiosporidium cionae]|uniref:cation diffusion facilitator family transporter n=1 Tax=Rickettsia endosymbiont of Cardiosporidium cionae TaxID=2777155 RepID=UPI001894F5D4|nr:cation diffusion facilitator family transporter [Rickettsia endosymbiont of Cardiosporidium cionae]KAF8818724.1 cation transporter [Rickettsia endosymbiont of Cardiosporidium cionae]